MNLQEYEKVQKELKEQVDVLTELCEQATFALRSANALCERLILQRNEAWEEIEKMRNHLNGVE